MQKTPPTTLARTSSGVTAPGEGGGTTVYPVVDSEEAIAAFANWGVITFRIPPGHGRRRVAARLGGLGPRPPAGPGRPGA